MSRALKEITTNQLKRLKPFLDEIVTQVEQPEYIKNDPVCFVHAFDEKEDRLLAGFFAALFAWGRRDVIIAKTQELLERMDYQPAAFIAGFSDKNRKRFDGFKHRTFKPDDIYWLIKALHKILVQYHSFETFWCHCYEKAQKNDRELLTIFHDEFFKLIPESPLRVRKHISNPEKKSSCKRLYMFLRWVIRKNSAVDAGIMNFMPPSELQIPLDVHAARQARILGLLSRRYNDWKAVQQLTDKLRLLNPDDPAKYDFALFGLGINNTKMPKEVVLNEI